MLNVGTRYSRENSESVQSYTAFVTDADRTLELTDKVTIVSLSSDAYSTITLPSVGEAAGEIFIIRLVAVGTGTCTIEDKNDDGALEDIILTAAGDFAVLCSDGLAWITLTKTATAA